MGGKLHPRNGQGAFTPRYIYVIILILMHVYIVSSCANADINITSALAKLLSRLCKMTLAQRYFAHRSNVIAMQHLIQRWFNRLAQQAMHILR